MLGRSVDLGSFNKLVVSNLNSPLIADRNIVTGMARAHDRDERLKPPHPPNDEFRNGSGSGTIGVSQLGFSNDHDCDDPD